MPVRRALALATSAVAAALGCAAGILAVPGALPAASAATACPVTGATLTWGFKTSFRAYIQSSIANGSWTTSGNATYTTPNFTWSRGTGTFDAAATSGQISFTGGVRFTGHEGLLDSTFSNLRLKFTNATTAVLVLDYTGTSMADATSGSATPKTFADIGFVDLTLASGTRGVTGATTTFTSVPTSITAAGYAAFGSYPAGTAFDPMTISITAACAASSPSTTPAAPAAGTTRASGATTATSAPSPGIEGATGLQIPASGAASPSAPPTGADDQDGGTSSTKTLGVLASAESRKGSLGDGLLFGFGGVLVGIGATLLTQFTLAKRKAGRAG